MEIGRLRADVSNGGVWNNESLVGQVERLDHSLGIR